VSHEPAFNPIGNGIAATNVVGASGRVGRAVTIVCSRIERAFVRLVGPWACAAPLLAGCTTPPSGATGAALARGHDTSDYGARVFATECVKCHGKEGEGFSDAPPILGPRALPEFPRESSPSGTPGIYDPAQMEIAAQTQRIGSGLRAPFRNAADLEAYVAAHMPKKRAKLLGPEGTWALVTFMMAVQGADVPEGGINAENAESTAIPRR
jgi:mono/diheme cytochrome c family protein